MTRPDFPPHEASLAMRAEGNFFRNFKVICPVQPCAEKHSASRLTQIISLSPSSCPGGGALAIVTNVGAGCGGRGSVVARGGRRASPTDLVSDRPARDERRCSRLYQCLPDVHLPAKPLGGGGLRTAKPRGPGTRCWCLIGGGLASPTGRTRPLSADDGDKTNSS